MLGRGRRATKRAGVDQQEECFVQKIFKWKLGRQVLFVLALGGAALLVPALAGARTGSAPNPSCGSTVHSNVTLHGNMDCPTSNGLVVGRSDITINLNGFTILGNRSADDYGIDNRGGHNNVTVKNGTIKDFYVGIWYLQSSGGKIQNAATTGNYFGVIYESSSNGMIDKLTSDGNEFGVDLDGNSKITLSDSQTNNNAYDGVMDQSSLDTLDGDTMNDNGSAMYSYCGSDPSCWGNTYFSLGDGLFVYQPLATSVVENSAADGNSNNGVVISDNAPPSQYQTMLMGDKADRNGDEDTVEPTVNYTAIGWGFWAQRETVGYDNAALDNDTGSCRDVHCGNLVP